MGDEVVSINGEAVTSPTQGATLLKEAVGEVKICAFRDRQTATGVVGGKEELVRERVVYYFSKPADDSKCGIFLSPAVSHDVVAHSVTAQAVPQSALD